MKKPVIVVLLSISLFAVQCKNQEGKNEIVPSKEIVLKNVSTDSLLDKPVIIKRSNLKFKDSTKYPVLTSGNTIYPLQVSDIDQDGVWDEIFLVANFAPNETKHLELKWTEASKLPEYTKRTSARFGKRETEDEPVEPATGETLTKNDMPAKQGFQKYQTDGPSWENDKVGFREYLDGRYSKDVFGKRIPDISPENVGINKDTAVEDNYHVMEDWGRDILAVGNSVGLGGFGLIVNETVHRLGALVTDTVSNVELTRFKIQEEGPVKSVLTFNYQDWCVGGNMYDVEETTTIWPGIYGFKNTVKISGLQGNEQLAVGLVNINNQNPLQEIKVNDDWVVLITHDHQTYEREWILGLALILPRDAYLGYMEAPKTGKLTDSFLAKLNIQNSKPISYYAMAGWELSQEERFADPEFFKQYVIDTAEQLSAEVEVEIN
ncbi:DUF4861 domain-containing protein [Christiangramia fulva]|uniref:DUF4861 domain-containing protein n=1 Tax=Christiangramia fulva TaxID=2126553 RepID=A0A2R3ZAX2_9FLAO|nr:DUF4861 domain-containing protein [Christiangramia fulva]AVR47419.1 DUF4861 domain-containing protein [Christiangramia fulva]